MNNKNPCSIALLIPVYNSPDVLKDLFLSLKKNTTVGEIFEIIIGDDGSDSMTKEVIKQFQISSGFNIKAITRETNFGYLRNVNDLYTKTNADIVVLLNTDIILPNGWIERIKAPFEIYDDVGLATPFSTNATNLTILPNIGQSWIEVDLCLSSLSPKYPNAHTAVGFCLAIRKKHFNDLFLFDESYLHGYWEETDLHYRCITMGYRSIVIDDLFVYHARGSSSFSKKVKNHDSLLAIGETNKKIFQKKWKYIHEQKERNYLQEMPYGKFRFDNYYFKFYRKNVVVDILFVLPGIFDKCGGIEVVTAMAKHLLMNGINAVIYAYGNVDENMVDFCNPWRDIKHMKACISQIKVVCATIYSSVEIAEEIADLFNSKIYYLVQGPETLFNNGKDFATAKYDYCKDNINIVCASQFLHNYLQLYGANKTKQLSLGADAYKFYPLDQSARCNKSIAICLRDSRTKGTEFALHCAWLARTAGFAIHFFGKDSAKFNLPAEFGINHGDLDSHKIRMLFNEVEFYMDLSIFEGLGLLSLEAAYCGAIPILSYNGGSNFIFDDNQTAFFIHPLTGDDFFDNLKNISSEQIDAMRIKCQFLSKKYSLEYACCEFMEYIYNDIKPIIANQICDRAELFIFDKKHLQSARYGLLHRILLKIYFKFQGTINYFFNIFVYKATYQINKKIDLLNQKVDKQNDLLNQLVHRN